MEETCLLDGERFNIATVLSMAAAGLWWVTAAGPVAVYRTLIYNFSGVDDYRIFPQRNLSSGSRAFKFSEGEIAQLAGYNLAFGDRLSPLDERNVITIPAYAAHRVAPACSL